VNSIRLIFDYGKRTPRFCFDLDYGEKIMSCEVIMEENGYDILLDGRWMASIAQTEDWT
jgi:hypothetical protein